jgi:hypothetical protein
MPKWMPPESVWSSAGDDAFQRLPGLDDLSGHIA